MRKVRLSIEIMLKLADQFGDKEVENDTKEAILACSDGLKRLNISCGELIGFIPGSTAEHIKTGNEYEIESLAFDPTSRSYRVVYSADGMTFSRDLAEFLEKFNMEIFISDELQKLFA